MTAKSNVQLARILWHASHETSFEIPEALRQDMRIAAQRLEAPPVVTDEMVERVFQSGADFTPGDGRTVIRAILNAALGK